MVPNILAELLGLTELLLFGIALVAGFVDAIAGGGGLITVPALLLSGASPLQALATNKLQGLFGSGSATLAFAAKGHLRIRQDWPPALACFFGAILGAAIATVTPKEALAFLMPVILIATAMFFAFKKNLDDTDRAQLIGPAVMGFCILPLIGLYDGFFGPGAGSFYMLALVTLGGMGVLKATARTKMLNFASNIGGFLGFLFAGAILWKTGLIMAAAQVLGARLGAGLAMKSGARLIKPLLVVICLAMAVRLLLDARNPLMGWIGLS